MSRDYGYTKWEYKLVDLPVGPVGLSRYGADGWEAVFLIAGAILFKRSYTER